MVPIVDGTVGTVQTDTGPSLQDIDCPSANQCEAGGAAPNPSTYEGVVDQINLVANQLTISSLTLDPASPSLADSSVTATLTVRNDFADTVTDVVPTLTSSNPAALQVTSGPSPTSQASLAPGATATFTYQLTPLQAATVQLQPGASGTDAAEGAVTAPAAPPLQVTVDAADLSVVLAANPTTVAAGGSTTVTATITNETAKTLTALTPSLAASPSAGLNIGAPTPASLATLAPHASTTVTWPVTTIDPGNFTLTASVQVTDPDTGVETDTGTTPLPVVDPAIIVTTTGDEALTSDQLATGICDVDPDTAGNQCTLRAAIQLANSLGGSQSITFDIPGGGVPDIAPASALPALQASITIDWHHGTRRLGPTLRSFGGRDVGRPECVRRTGGHPGPGDRRLDRLRRGCRRRKPRDVDRGEPHRHRPDRHQRRPQRIRGPGRGPGGDDRRDQRHVVVDLHRRLQPALGQRRRPAGVDPRRCLHLVGGLGHGGRQLHRDRRHGRERPGQRRRGGQRSQRQHGQHGTIRRSTSITGAAPGNLISGNRINGLDLDGIDTVQGNLIGEDRSGSLSLQPSAPFNPPDITAGGSNLGIGVLVGNAGVVTAGGSSEADRNVIGGFGNVGVAGPAMVENDEIGTNPAGTAAIPNGDGAAAVATVTDSLVSGNADTGVEAATTVTGDRIGTTADGQSALPNGTGVAEAHLVGGDRPAVSRSAPTRAI